MRNQGLDEFQEFLKLLSMAQRAEDRDFDTSRVIIFECFCINMQSTYNMQFFSYILRIDPPSCMSVFSVQLSSSTGLLSWSHSYFLAFLHILLILHFTIGCFILCEI